MSDGPALTSAICLAYARSHRPVEAHSNIGSRSETAADGRTEGFDGRGMTMSGFQGSHLTSRNWGHRIYPRRTSGPGSRLSPTQKGQWMHWITRTDLPDCLRHDAGRGASHGPLAQLAELRTFNPSQSWLKKLRIP